MRLLVVSGEGSGGLELMSLASLLGVATLVLPR